MADKLIKVVIVDDQLKVRLGLSIVLEEFEDFELAGEAGNGRDAVELVEKAKPDVVLMDLLCRSWMVSARRGLFIRSSRISRLSC